MSHIRRLMANRPLAFLQYKLNDEQIRQVKSNIINTNVNNKQAFDYKNTFNIDQKKWNTFYLQKIIDTNYGHNTNLIGHFKCNSDNKMNISPPIYKTNFLLTREFEQYKLDYEDLANFMLISTYNCKHQNLTCLKSVILPKEIHLVRKFGLVW